MRNQTLDSFLLFPSNRDAWTAVRRWTSKGQPQQTLVLQGPSGVGKTHLAHGAAAEFQENRIGVRVETAESWLNQFIAALRKKTLHEFRNEWQCCPDVLILEHVEDLEGKDHTTDGVMEMLKGRVSQGLLSMVTATARSEKDIRGVLQQLTCKCNPHVVQILPPEPAELDQFAKKLTPETGGLCPSRIRCFTSVPEILGEVNRRSFLAAMD